ncbi:hypothetical protein BDZ97DRAFT_1821344 [Flammula alnicola]|nr:hypothetical protein BDZ97DRAFT_1821344 [Flammula alnicola]
MSGETLWVTGMPGAGKTILSCVSSGLSYCIEDPNTQCTRLFLPHLCKTSSSMSLPVSYPC